MSDTATTTGRRIAAGALIRKGPRVALRLPEMADAADIADGLASWDVVKNLTRVPHPYTLADAVQWIGQHQSARDGARNDFPFAIVTGDGLIGVVGVHLRTNETELGYWLRQSAWGQGYATEAARLALAFAFDELDLSDVEAGYFADNPASGRVLTKLGFAYTGDESRFSLARDCDVACRRMILPRARFAEGRTKGGASHGG